MLCVVCSYYVLLVFFFFFKHKTAYEMRISDWSSDVCSSDLVSVMRFQRDFAPGGSLDRPPGYAVAGLFDRDDILHELGKTLHIPRCEQQIGRASCRERVCQYV